MKDILKRLKIIDNLTTDLELSRAEFVEKLSAITDKGDIGLFSDTFDAFSSSKNELKGRVDFNGFKLKRRRRRAVDLSLKGIKKMKTIINNDSQRRICTDENEYKNSFKDKFIENRSMSLRDTDVRKSNL